jgi:hypothetical protein
LRNSPGWVALHARRTGTLGVKYFGWCKIILILDVLGRLPAEFPSGRLGVVDPVENVRADETGVPLYWAYPRSTIGVVALPMSLAWEGEVHVVRNDTVANDTRLRYIIGKRKKLR